MMAWRISLSARLVAALCLASACHAGQMIRPGDTVRVRIGPAPVKDESKTRILTTVPARAELKALRVTEGWVQVSVERNGEAVVGWIAALHLTLAEPREARPDDVGPLPAAIAVRVLGRETCFIRTSGGQPKGALCLTVELSSPTGAQTTIAKGSIVLKGGNEQTEDCYLTPLDGAKLVVRKEGQTGRASSDRHSQLYRLEAAVLELTLEPGRPARGAVLFATPPPERAGLLLQFPAAAPVQVPGPRHLVADADRKIRIADLARQSGPVEVGGIRVKMMGWKLLPAASGPKPKAGHEFLVLEIEVSAARAGAHFGTHQCALAAPGGVVFRSYGLFGDVLNTGQNVFAQFNSDDGTGIDCAFDKVPQHRLGLVYQIPQGLSLPDLALLIWRRESHLGDIIWGNGKE